MDLNATIDFIIKDLNEAREIIDDLKKYPGVPELQVELAKSKCKSASEVISLLKKQESVGVPDIEIKSPVTGDMTRDTKEEKKDIPQSPTVEVFIEKRISETFMSDFEQDVKGHPENQIPSIKKVIESAIIADQFSNRPESFNEKIGSLKHEDDVLQILRTKPLSSLDEAIGINDKFLFIREIFDGNTELYNQVIQKLESVANLSDAMAVIMSHCGDNSGNEAARQLIDLIKRKFLSHE
jgi:hypothetical protein